MLALPPCVTSFHTYGVKVTFHFAIAYEVLPSLKYASPAWCLMIKVYHIIWILTISLVRPLILEPFGYFLLHPSVHLHDLSYVYHCMLLLFGHGVMSDSLPPFGL